MNLLQLSTLVIFALLQFNIAGARVPVVTSLTARAAVRMNFPRVTGISANPTATNRIRDSLNNQASQTTTIGPLETGECAYFLSVLTSCEDATPGFSSLQGSQQASCACYSSNSWIPESIDSAISSCAMIAFTAVPSDYSLFSSLEGFCLSIGNVRTTSLISSTITPTSTRASGTSIIESSGTPTTTVGSGPTLVTSTETPTPTPPGGPVGSAPGIQDLTNPQKIGISVGGACAGLLALFGIYLAFGRKRLRPFIEAENTTTDLVPEKGGMASMREEGFRDSPEGLVAPVIRFH